MKLLLLKLSALALVASSGVYALEEKQALRGSVETGLSRQVNSVVSSEVDGEQDSNIGADAAVLVREDKKDDDKKKKKKKKRRSKRKRNKKKRSRRRKRNICRRSNLKSSRDRKTCRRLRREVCDDRKMRKRHSGVCRYAGFATLAEGAAEDAPETYADDTEIFLDEEADNYDRIIEEIEEELEDEDFADEDSVVNVLVGEDGRKSKSKRNICRRMKNSRDRKTCRRMRRDLCDNRRMRKRNRRICNYVGFATVAEGAAEDAPETYADDTEIFSDEEAESYDMIIEDIEDELREDGNDEIEFVAWTFLPV
eukprot:CAMPEP_0172575316 /NCGR_PEP_ID=MMETSP1067-20121228/137153_1 /TAXON_ID=265564 ORGANISM="Thalassiosira punctigera, Strain Tpunct2005C2" /NCGR_SAMPLE_ID=MMETSP1067 /ASSEMBLY_ACC=CAM_ASM_000444 /LENGTH=309 /DNA_ID=CAMNT_0013367965 /DNA_START=20 /DNA_END=949 /DNA_ORIENTATION=-